MRKNEFLATISACLLLIFACFGALLSLGCTAEPEPVCDDGELHCPWDPYRVWECQGGQWAEIQTDTPCVDGEMRGDLKDGSDCGDLQDGDTIIISQCYSFYCHVSGVILGCEACEPDSVMCDPYPEEFLP